jgi:hypothetical protein
VLEYNWGFDAVNQSIKIAQKFGTGSIARLALDRRESDVGLAG